MGGRNKQDLTPLGGTMRGFVILAAACTAVVGRAAVMELGYTGDYYRGFVRTALVPMLVILALCTAVMIYSRELGALIGG